MPMSVPAGVGIHSPVLVRTMRDDIDTIGGNDELVLRYPGSVFDDAGLKRRSVAQAAALIAKQQARHPTPSLQGAKQVPCNPFRVYS